MEYGHASPEYRKYLKSQAWTVRKKLYYQRHPRACASCGKRPVWRKWWQVWKPKDWLNLHHVSYANQRANPGHEPDKDLSPQCRRCHDEIHARHKAGAFAQYGDDSLRRTTEWVIKKKQRELVKRQAKMVRKLARA